MPTTLQDDLDRTIPGSGIRSILINVLVGTGVALGLAPLAGFVGHLPWLIYVFAASALISSGKTGRVFTAAVEQPSWWHFAVSGCGTLFPAAVLGVLGFVLVAVNWLLNLIFR